MNQNYKFSKFCWERLVQPSLRGSNYQTGVWMLDNDHGCRYTSGAIDVLASHVHLTTLTNINIAVEVHRYDTSVEVNVNEVTLSAGNALLFSKSLVNATVQDTHAICKLVFIPDAEGGLNISTDDPGLEAGGGSAPGSGPGRI